VLDYLTTPKILECILTINKNNGLSILANIVFVMCLVIYLGGNIYCATNQSGFPEYYNRASFFSSIIPDSTLFYAQKTDHSTSALNKKNQQIDSLLLSSKTNIVLGNFGDAYNEVLYAKQIANSNKLNDRKVEILITLGSIFRINGYHSEAIDIILEAKAHIDSITNPELIGELYYYLGLVYSDINETRRSKKYLRLAIKYSLEKSNFIQL
jgi:tetratricopeptide (TPR) repeat protein